MLYPQNGDRTVAVYFVTSFHPVYNVRKENMGEENEVNRHPRHVRSRQLFRRGCASGNAISTMSMAVCNQPHRYGNSHATRDHTVDHTVTIVRNKFICVLVCSATRQS